MSGRTDFKVVMLGGLAAGKTSILIRYIKSKFDENIEGTIAGVFMKKAVECNGKSFNIGIWDTCGQERFHALVRMYYRDAHAAVVCYDITDAKSWPYLKRCVEELRDVNPECKVYICGTKKDLVDMNTCKREVDLAVISFYTKGIQAKWIETSSKTGENVDELFQFIAQDFSAIYTPSENTKSTVDLSRIIPKKSKCRC